MLSARTSLVVFLVFTALSLAALIALGWRSLGGFEATIARVLRQASVYTAEQISQQIQRDLRSPIFDLLEQVDHTAIRTFDVPKIAETLRAAGAQHFGLIDTFFVWSYAPGPDPSLAGLSMDRRVLFYSKNAARAIERVSAPGTAGENGFFSHPELASIFLKEAQQWASVQKPFALSYLEFEGHRYQVVYHFLFNSNVRPVLGGVEGFVADAEYLRANYFAQLVSRWRSDTTRDPGSPSLAISIVDTEGREVLRSGRSLLERYDARAEFPFLFFEPDLFESLSPYHPPVHYWNVRTGYDSGDINAIASEQTAPQRVAWLLASLVAAIGIGLTARSATREMRVSEMKSDFVTSISHDLGTPLAKIQLYADTLESGRARSQEKFEAYCRVISFQAKKLTHLIKELMDFSEIEAGVRHYEMEELDLRDVLNATIELFEHELTQDDVTTEVVMPETPVRVLGSFEGLQQLFGNVINNALKYSLDERFLRIALGTSDGHAIVQVTDHGVGVAKNEQRRIFKKFYRGAAASGIAGSGIGLAIVDHVVRAHRGTVGVTSNVGPGTTFTVKLPLLAVATEPSEVCA